MGAAVDAVLIITVVLSISLNAIVIMSLLKRWRKLAANDVILLTLSMVDFFQAIIGYPLEINANLITNRLACVVAGFSTTTLALISISLLTAMAISRMISISYPLKSQSAMKQKRTSLYFTIPSVLYGLLWGIFPLVGWSKYAPELGNRQRCSISFDSGKQNTLTYLYFLLIFCFVLPVTIMVIMFLKIRTELKRMAQQDARRSGSQSGAFKSTYKRQKRVTVLILVMFLAFLVAWTPYTIVVFIVAMDIRPSSEWLNTAALLGKSSTFYNPIIYALLYKQFRMSLLELFGIRSTRIFPVSIGDTELRTTRLESKIKDN